jgi:hypothetical protein
MDDRTPLARLLEAEHPEVARLIRDPATTVTRLPTPFLRDGLIFRIEWFGPHRPVTLTAGWARPGGGLTVLLAANPDGFDALAKRAGVALETEAQRVAYAVTRLEVTRRFDETFKVLHGFDDLRPMANPDPPQAARLRALAAEWPPRIEPPRSAPAESGWIVPVYVLSRNDLCLFTVAIRHDGTAAVTKSMLEADTPLLPRPSGR